MTKFSDKIAQVAEKKKSRVIVALDPDPSKHNVKQYAIKTIESVADHVCAVKVNFHLLLPLSSSEIAEVTKSAHNHQLLCIADMKLNDIENTNEVVVYHLAKMGFDAVIANPFMGTSTLASLVRKAHLLDMGVIALVYMSHADAAEGYGLESSAGPLYTVFLERAIRADADGIVIGAAQAEILREVVAKKKEFKVSLSVYSPGIGAQGGDARQAIENGSDYLIVGRSIINAKDPAAAAENIRLKSFSL
jgi:orotidine-5'-phosphate decarboxylase